MSRIALGRTLTIVMLAGVLALMGVSAGSAQEQDSVSQEPFPMAQTGPESNQKLGWGYGIELGAWFETANDAVFTMVFNGEHYVNRAFSFGILGVLSPFGDLNQIGVTGTARWHVMLNEKFELIPYVGFGLLYANLSGNDDIGFYMPFAATAAYTVSPNIAVTGTLMLNVHDLNYSPPVDKDQGSVGLGVGIIYQP